MLNIVAGLLVLHAVYWFLGTWHLPHPLSFGVGVLTLITAVAISQNRAWARYAAAAIAICVPSVWVFDRLGLFRGGALKTLSGVIVGSTINLHAQALVPTALLIGASLLPRLGRAAQLMQPVAGHSGRQLSRIFLLCAAIAEIWTYASFRLTPGTSQGIALVFGTAESALPFLLATAVCCVCGYLLTPRPRGAVRAIELVTVLLASAALLMPVLFLLRTTLSDRAN